MNVLFENPRKAEFTSDLHVVSVAEQDLKKRKAPSSSGPQGFVSMNQRAQGSLAARLNAQKFKPELGKSALLYFSANDRLMPLLVVGAEEKNKSRFDHLEGLRKIGALAVAHAQREKATRISFAVPHLNLARPENLYALLEGAILGQYRFVDYKTKDEDKPAPIEELIVFQNGKAPATALREAEVLCAATALARNLINMPARDCTPGRLVEEAKTIAQQGKLKLDIFDRPKLERLKAGALLAVAEGSTQPPYLIKLTYKPAGKPRRVISLLGKGITFDSGGMSLKPAKSMEDMKCDMSGAAAVLGAMQAVSILKPRVEVRGYIPTTENMINGSATKPGDIVRSLSGKTIEILNTDAEGRLILADALALAEKDKCDVMIDLATLTGACMVALGSDYAGIFSDAETLQRSIIAAGEQEGERFWPLPLAKEYAEQLKSSVADVKNIGGQYGGAISGALFLKEFVEKTPWAHLDIAGPAFTDKEKGYVKAGGVGFGVRTLMRYILSR